MLKDYSSIKEVVEKKKESISLLFVKVYRVLKNYKDKEANLLANSISYEFINKLMAENFRRISQREDIHTSDLEIFANLSGASLTHDEIELLSKLSSKNGQVIFYQDMISAIYHILNNVKLEPTLVCNEVFNKHALVKDKKLVLEAFEDFLYSTKLLEKDEIYEILREVSYLKNEAGTVYAEDVCLLIRDSIEGFAR